MLANDNVAICVRLVLEYVAHDLLLLLLLLVLLLLLLFQIEKHVVAVHGEATIQTVYGRGDKMQLSATVVVVVVVCDEWCCR